MVRVAGAVEMGRIFGNWRTNGVRALALVLGVLPLLSWAYVGRPCTPRSSFKAHPRAVTEGAFMPRLRARGSMVVWSSSIPREGVGSMAGSLRAGKRAQRLKDILLDKELRADINTAEFALGLDLPAQPETSLGQIDYERLAEKLEKSLELIDRRQGRMTAAAEQSTADLTKRLADTKRELVSVLTRVRDSTRGPPGGRRLAQGEGEGEGEGDGEGGNLVNPFTVFVREDGTVDWDGVLESGKDLAKFSGDLLTRLSGKSPEEEEEETSQQAKPTSLAAIDSSEAIRPLLRMLDDFEGALATATDERNKVRELHRAMRRTGNEVTKEQKAELRLLEDNVVELRRRTALQRLDLDMERICTYIEQEIEQSTSFREQKLLVAEFGLLDTQLTTLISMLSEPELDGSTLIELDEEELKVVAAEVQDLKTRLGLVEDPGNNKIDWSGLQTFVRESVDKIRSGVNFYVSGTKLLASDIQYASWLISRAAQGYTLKPREVRTLRRTAKDLLVVIPFTIILIIPMTPIGHVLVFSLIQRIFPGFFPSTFTDRRQNLSKMYEEIEKKPLPTAADGR